MAQMPLERTIRYRSRRNTGRDGSMIQLADMDYEERSWDLTFHDLTDEEWAALEDLFAATEGRLGSFTFLEPGANLLAWSERLTHSAWSVSGSAMDELPGPFGAARGSRLTAGSSASQTIAAPANYCYVASAWLRTSGAGAKIRVSDAGSHVVEADVDASGDWRRYVVSYASSSTTDAMQLSLVAGSGGSLDIYGPQVEAQLAASAYKVSSDQGGVFANTRFDQDALIDEAHAPSRHDTRVRLIWTPSQL